MASEDPYTLLGITESADDAAIKKAYLNQVRAHPPERAPERFKAIRAAYETLSNVRSRLRYQLFEQPAPNLDRLIEALLNQAAAEQTTLSRPSEHTIRQALAAAVAADLTER